MKLTKEQLKKKKAAAILGGIARAQKLSKSKRKRIATLGGYARWSHLKK